MFSPFQLGEGGQEGKESLLLPGDGRLFRVRLAQEGSVLVNTKYQIVPLKNVVTVYLVLRLEILVHQVTDHGFILRIVGARHAGDKFVKARLVLTAHQISEVLPETIDSGVIQHL